MKGCSQSITIIIPVKPGGTVKALEGLRRVLSPAGCLEVLVAEGRQPSRQRNRAAELARGEILCFLDDDSMVGDSYLERLAGHFTDSTVVAVGGPSLTPSSDTLWQQGFGVALASLFGGGGARNRYRRTGAVRETDDHELILCNLAIRREVFLGYGGLDERLYPNEENELLERLRSAGMRLLHDPELAVHRSQRPNLPAFRRQFFTYGRGRAEQTLLSGKLRITNLIPGFFLLYLCLLPLADNHVYYLPLLCYALMLLLFSFLGATGARRPELVPCLMAIFPTMHLAYGAGLWWGLIRPRFRGKRQEAEEVTIRQVQL